MGPSSWRAFEELLLHTFGADPNVAGVLNCSQELFNIGPRKQFSSFFVVPSIYTQSQNRISFSRNALRQRDKV